MTRRALASPPKDLPPCFRAGCWAEANYGFNVFRLGKISSEIHACEEHRIEAERLVFGGRVTGYPDGFVERAASQRHLPITEGLSGTARKAPGTPESTGVEGARAQHGVQRAGQSPRGAAPVTAAPPHGGQGDLL